MGGIIPLYDSLGVDVRSLTHYRIVVIIVSFVKME